MGIRWAWASRARQFRSRRIKWRKFSEVVHTDDQIVLVHVRDPQDSAPLLTTMMAYKPAEKHTRRKFCLTGLGVSTLMFISSLLFLAVIGHTGNVNICTVSDYKMRKVYCDPYYHPISSIKNYISHATETVTSSDSTSTSSSEHHIDSPEREICSYKVYWHVTWLRDFRPTTNSDLDQWQSLYEKEKEQEKKLSQTQNAPGKASKSQITTGIIAGEEYVTYAEALAAAREHNTHKSGLCRIAMATHARTSWFDEEAERQQYGLVLLWSLMSGVMTLFFSVAVICLYRRSTLEAFKKLSYSQWDRNSPSPRHGPFASPIKSPMSGALPSPMLHAHVHAHAHGHARSPSTRRSPYSTPMKAGGYLPANRGSPSSFSLSEVTTQLSGLSVINISSSPPRNSISTQRDTSQ